MYLHTRIERELLRLIYSTYISKQSFRVRSLWLSSVTFFCMKSSLTISRERPEWVYIFSTLEAVQLECCSSPMLGSEPSQGMEALPKLLSCVHYPYPSRF